MKQTIVRLLFREACQDAFQTV